MMTDREIREREIAELAKAIYINQEEKDTNKAFTLAERFIDARRNRFEKVERHPIANYPV